MKNDTIENTIHTFITTGLFLIFILNTIPAQAQATSTIQISGEMHLIGQVDVHNLPSGTNPERNNIQSVHEVDSQQFAQEKEQADSQGFVPPGRSAKVIVAASNAPRAVSSNLILEGAPGDLPNPCSCSPPDPNLGVGPNHVFEMVNLAGIIYSKSGTVMKNTFPLSNFFLLPTSSMSDPEILFDAGSDRWFASIVDIPDGRVQFAVSTSNDPTGTWNLYYVSTPAKSTLPDQPFIGVSDDKFVISVNDFAGGGTTFAGVQYWIINKAELAAGASTVHFATNTPDTRFASVHPAQHLGSSSGQFYMVSIYPAGTANSATLFTVGGVPGISTVTVTPNSFSISPISVPPNAVQPGTSTTLATPDDRVLSAVWESNTLWFSANDACNPIGDTTARSCVRLIQITTSGTLPPSKVQDFDYSAPGQYFFYPAVSLSQGQLVVVYGLSSSTVYPSLLVTGRNLSDSPNTLQTPFTIRSGTAPDTSTRYGDYFGAATDPTPSANSTFWVAGEYRVSSGFQSWNTAIAQVAAFGNTSPFLSVSANPSTITTTQTSTITASTSDSQSGVIINFITTLGLLNSTSCISDSTGRCSVIFNSSATGTGTITASNLSYTSGSTTVKVTLPSLSVSANPSTITTTQTSTITASTSDGKPSVMINFITTLGSLNSTSCISDSTGKCSVIFRSSSTGTARITASNSSYISSQATVTIRRRRG